MLGNSEKRGICRNRAAYTVVQGGLPTCKVHRNGNLKRDAEGSHSEDELKLLGPWSFYIYGNDCGKEGDLMFTRARVETGYSMSDRAGSISSIL
jgi:hypothetical protein